MSSPVGRIVFSVNPIFMWTTAQRHRNGSGFTSFLPPPSFSPSLPPFLPISLPRSLPCFLPCPPPPTPPLSLSSPPILAFFYPSWYLVGTWKTSTLALSKFKFDSLDTYGSRTKIETTVPLEKLTKNVLVTPVFCFASFRYKS